MIGLRVWERDASLPARRGEPELVPLAPEELADLVQTRARRSGSPAVRDVRWEYARWRPGDSTSCAYTVRFTDGEERLLATKQLAPGRSGSSAARGDAPRALDRRCDRLLPRVLVEERNLVLWGFPADRALLGHALVLDTRGLARLIEESGLAPPRSVRRRRLRCALLRYKPEHRSVWRVDVSLRAGEVSSLALAARVLRPRHLERTLAVRAAPSPLAAAGLTPAVRAWATREGLLLEEWLEVETFAPDHFAHAADAGAVLARLHALPPGDVPDTPALAPRSELRPLFSLDGELEAPASHAGASGTAGPKTWIHGDFHPDQVARTPDGAWRLLDLDLAGLGDPARDLASWIADHLAERGEDDWSEAAEPLLAGYARGGGEAVDEARLRARVSDALVRRAAAAIRRLERGAVAKARRLLARAASVRAPAGVRIASARRSLLDEALARTADAVGRSDVAASVERVEMRPRLGLVLTLAEERGWRWFRWDGSSFAELAPDEDRRVPLARTASGHRLLSWRPGRRVVLEDQTGPRVRILKGFRRGRAAAAAAAHRHGERANGRGGFQVPRLVEVRAEDETIVFERIEGEPLPLGGEAAERFRALGAHLASFQAQALPDDVAPFGPAAELRVLDVWAERVHLALGALPEGWSEERRILEALAPRVVPDRLVPCHRDLHDRQFLVTDRGLALLDFDLLTRADAALDPANLLAHLVLRRLQGRSPEDREGETACRTALLAGLGRRGEAFEARGSFYEATSFLRLALVYAIRPRWRHLSLPLVQEGRRCLEERRRRDASRARP